MITILQNPMLFKKMITENDLVLVDFYADWCEPCKWLDTILVKLDERVTFPLIILKINTDHNLHLTHHFGLKSVPVLFIFQNGLEVWRMNGFLPEEKLFDKIYEFHVERGNRF